MAGWHERFACVLALAAVGGTSLGSGCGDDGLSTGSTGTTSGGTTTGGEMPVTPIRQVLQRNPWGSPAMNLLVDGDFELSTAGGTGQYGWVAFSADQTALVPLAGETGGTCRSGIRCAIISKGQALLGRGTAAANMAPHQASIFARPVTPPAPDADLSKVCAAVVKVQMVTCDDGVIVATLKPAPAPGNDGYCEYAGPLGPFSKALCMYVDVKADAIVDNATLLPASTAMSAPAPFELDVAEQSRAKQAAELVRKRIRYGEPSGSEEGRALHEDLR